MANILPDHGSLYDKIIYSVSLIELIEENGLLVSAGL